MTAKVNSKTLGKRLERLSKIADLVMPEALTYFKGLTPKRSGNARRKTNLDRNNRIKADYDYAAPLDQGLSRQAPQGMTKPTEKRIAQLVSRYLQRLGA